MEWISRDDLLKLVEARGLPVQRQAAFLKVQAGSKIMHIANPPSGRCTRVDLKGFDGVGHPALRTLSRKDAAQRHLGKVSRQIDFTDASAAMGAFKACLATMEPPAEQPPTAPSGVGVGEVGVTVTLRLRRDLYDAIEEQRIRIERESPKGVEVTIESAIRALLHEAVEACRGGDDANRP